MIKSSYRIDRALFSFSKWLELVLIIRIWNKLAIQEIVYVKSFDSNSSDFKTS